MKHKIRNILCVSGNEIYPNWTKNVENKLIILFAPLSKSGFYHTDLHDTHIYPAKLNGYLHRFSQKSLKTNKNEEINSFTLVSKYGCHWLDFHEAHACMVNR
jgi:hypothetical protein